MSDLLSLPLAAIAAISLSAAHSSEWRFISETQMDGVPFVIYADRASISAPDQNIRRMWVKYVIDPAQDPTSAVMNRLIEFDCKGRRSRLLQASEYSANGDVGNVDDKPKAWAFIEPDTTGQTELRAVCVGFNLDERIVDDPVADGRRLLFRRRLQDASRPRKR